MNSIAVRTALALGMVAGTVAAVMAQAGGSINLTVTGLRNDNGSVRCGLYNSAGAFPQAGHESRGVVAPISGRQAKGGGDAAGLRRLFSLCGGEERA